VSKKNDVKVYKKGEPTVDSRTLETAALAAIKNKPAESKKIAVEFTSKQI
jgi:hypothetical protein